MPLTFAAWDNFKLRTGTREPGSFRIGLTGGAAVLVGTIPTLDLDTILREGVESATPDNSTGRIRRILPVAHPRWPWMFLRNVDNATGVSFVEKVPADPDDTLEVPPMPYWSNYDTYEIQVTLEPRPYLMTADETIPKETLNYFDDAGNPIAHDVWAEWFRYVEWLPQPASEYLTADIGQMKWSVDAAPGDPLSPDDGSGAAQGVTRILMPATTWKINWYAVPYGYVLSDKSVFLNAIGRINQNTWAGFKAGTLLLQSVGVTSVYPCPFPDFTPYDGFDLVGQDKLCNIEFTMLEVKRDGISLPSPNNNSHIAAGHNLLPFRASGRFFYAENMRTGVAGTGFPTYLSYPYELLFQNPDWL